VYHDGKESGSKAKIENGTNENSENRILKTLLNATIALLLLNMPEYTKQNGVNEEPNYSLQSYKHTILKSRDADAMSITNLPLQRSPNKARRRPCQWNLAKIHY
jgi:hypothetical protein